MITKQDKRRPGFEAKEQVKLRAWVLTAACSAFIFGLLWYTALHREDETGPPSSYAAVTIQSVR